MKRIPFGFRPFAAWSVAALVTVCATSAAAQNLPARHSVTGVASGDVLNIRAAPSASAPILGGLAPGAADVEVLGFSPDGAWARLGLPEGEGWVARRFLAPEPQDPRAIPLPLRCLGTEPFWSLTVTEAATLFETPDHEARTLRPLGRAEGFGGFILAYDDRGETRDLTVMRSECGDGMSGRPYGFSALVWNRGEEVLEGCCLLLPR